MLPRRLHSLSLPVLCLSLGAAEPAIAPEQMPRVPPTGPAEAAATFTVRPGFRAELVAAEPLIASPVALAVDAQGRAYVVEMRDYSERRPERLGRVKRLEDTDADGRYDRATVFLDGLPWPTAITCWDGGVFIGATPDLLYAKDTDGDGRADVRETVFTGFASDYAPYATNKLNVQALLNSFHWGLDGRIHGATSMSGGSVRLVDSEFTRSWRARWSGDGQRPPSRSAAPINLRGRDFSFDPRTLGLRAEPGGGQHGMSFDDTGRKFVCSNSDHLQLIAFDDTAAPANPFHELPQSRHSIAADGPAAEVFRRSPDEPWRVLRTRWRVAGLVTGPIEGGGRPSGYFTGATGVTVYRGDAYGDDFAGDAFIADCGSNLIHRKKLRPAPDGILLIGARAPDEGKSEFLASTDNWFRPVQFYNAPDGCLWVVDMYRETIEHPWSLPANLKQHLDLDSGRERGRLWRIAPEGFKVQGSGFKVQSSDTAELVKLLEHPNGWHRDTAARLLVERGDTNAVPALRALVTAERGSPSRQNGSDLRLGEPRSRGAALHALHLLHALGALDLGTLAGALTDDSAAVRRHAVGLWGRLAAGGQDSIFTALQAMAIKESDPLVRLELAFALGRLPSAQRLNPLASLIRSGPALVQSASIHSAAGIEPGLWQQLTSGGTVPDFTEAAAGLTELAQVLGRQGRVPDVAQVLSSISAWQDHPLATAVAEGLARGLAMQRQQPPAAAQTWPDAFAQAWQRVTHPPPRPAAPRLAPPDPDRLAVLERFLPALDVAGDAKRGEAIFRERCASCHVFRGIGTPLGPDLAAASANGPNRLLVSILDPNREVSPNYAAWTAETKDAGAVTGLLVRESDSAITLRLAGGTETTLVREQLETFTTEGRSLMPEGLEDGLSAAELAGLLAWLAGE